MHKDSVPIGFVIFPLSLVVISIGMYEFPLPFCFVVLPLSFVNCTIWPLLLSRPVSEVSKPFAFVLYAVFELLQGLFLPFDSSSCLDLLRERRIYHFPRIIILISSRSLVLFIEHQYVLFFYLLHLLILRGFELDWVEVLLFFQFIVLIFRELVPEGFWDVVTEVCAL